MIVERMRPTDSGTRRLSGEGLRAVAMTCMLVDHATAAFLDWGMRYRSLLAGNGLAVWASTALHCVGRIAFPLYVFLLVEGFVHTRSRSLYLIRILLLATVSELPFDLALMLWRSQLERGVLCDSSHQNVLFTLALGFIAMWTLDELRALCGGRQSWSVLALCAVASLAAVGLCCLMASAFCTDYSWQGVLAVVAAYLVHGLGRPELEGLAMTCALVPYGPYELFGLACCPLLAAYDGSRGKPLLGTRFNYAFYPVHLLALGILRWGFVM